jgi:hypothetical protein
MKLTLDVSPDLARLLRTRGKTTAEGAAVVLAEWAEGALNTPEKYRKREQRFQALLRAFVDTMKSQGQSLEPFSNSASEDLDGVWLAFAERTDWLDEDGVPKPGTDARIEAAIIEALEHPEKFGDGKRSWLLEG